MVWRSKEKGVTQLIDMVALFFAISIGYRVSGSWTIAAISGAMVGLYGFWCFYDGITSGQRGKHD